MGRANVFSDECEYDDGDPAGYRASATNVSTRLGAEALAVKVFELPAGHRVCPYHR